MMDALLNTLCQITQVLGNWLTRIIHQIAPGTVPGTQYQDKEISGNFTAICLLKGFKRITLQPGEPRTVEFPIAPEHLAFFDINMEYVVEPGEFNILVGNSSRDEDLETVLLTVFAGCRFRGIERIRQFGI